MKEFTYKETVGRKALNEIAFYNNVVELFTLSRKLKSNIHNHNTTSNMCSKIALIAKDFSEQFLELPLSIAEVEVTKDPIKKIKINHSVHRKLSSIFRSWSIIREQRALPKDWRQQFEYKMKTLQTSYKDWSTLITQSN